MTGFSFSYCLYIAAELTTFIVTLRPINYYYYYIVILTLCRYIPEGV